MAGKKAVSIDLPTVDAAALLAEDERERKMDIPERFGKALDVDIDLSKSGTWETVPGGRIWRVQINAPGAKTINMIFDRFFLPEGAQVFVTNAERTMVSGPIDVTQNNEYRKYSTSLIKGSSMLIELYEPESVKTQSELHISKVIHGYKLTPFAGFGESAPCNENVTCQAFAAWQDEANMVAMVLLQDNTRWCSGSLLNNACQNFRPNFLTAFHCLDNNGNGVADQGEITAAQNWQFMFQYISPQCNPSVNAPNFFTFSGSTFRAGWNVSDFALVELNQRPTASSGIRYAGWSRATTAPTSSASLHHPKGDVMKVSIDNNAANSVDWNGANPNSHWGVDFDFGTVEPGSSGSPLFNQDSRVVGQLHGGLSNPGLPNGGRCQLRDGRYGRFDVSWNGGGTSATRLSDWLTDNPSVTQTNAVLIPSVSGPANALLCGSGSFVLNNAPASASVTWSVSPANAVSPSSGSGTTANVTSLSRTAATITFFVGCAPAGQFAQTFYSGAPSPPTSMVVMMGPSPNQLCLNSTMGIAIGNSNNTAQQGITQYNWSFGGWGSYFSFYDNVPLTRARAYFNLTIGAPSSQSLSVTAQNACGNSTPYSSTFFAISCGGFLMSYPNPAKGVLMLSFDGSSGPALPEKIELFNETSLKPVYQLSGGEIEAELNKGTTIQIPVNELARGTYYLHLTAGVERKIEKVRIVLE